MRRPKIRQIYIYGSDQIWNPYSLRKEYFLDFVDDNAIKMSYAASMGVSDIPGNAQDTFKLLVDNIDYVSVREHKAKELIEKTTERDDITVHSDPVLIVNPEKWSALQNNCNINEPYILCYFMYTPKWLNGLLRDIHKKTRKLLL